MSIIKHSMATAVGLLLISLSSLSHADKSITIKCGGKLPSLYKSGATQSTKYYQCLGLGLNRQGLQAIPQKELTCPQEHYRENYHQNSWQIHCDDSGANGWNAECGTNQDPHAWSISTEGVKKVATCAPTNSGSSSTSSTHSTQ